MSLKTLAARWLATRVAKKEWRESKKPIELQLNWLEKLVRQAAPTQFGREHDFRSIKSYEDFKSRVPISDYEGLRSYVDKAKKGDKDMLWPGKPIYFAKTSGTTSGAKYIPITKDSIHNHINSARNMLLHYVNQQGNADFLKGKMIFLSGSPKLEEENGIYFGRLSGIVNHHVPNYLQKNKLPGYQTNCIDDWEEKLDKIVEETLKEDMRLISGIPPWVQMYFDRLQEKTGRKIGEIFPNLQLLVHGGVNFSPYKEKLIESIGRQVDILETFPASEGFMAYQEDLKSKGLRLNVNSGIFFEFIPLEEYHKEQPARLHLGQVETGKNYAVILNSNAGLWGYSIGDTVEFLSVSPPRVIVTGRVKHFISAFGEHVIASEVSDALAETARKHNVSVIEFTVAPQVNPKSGLPYHEWFVEFNEKPEALDLFAQDLDIAMCVKNSYYRDLIDGQILRPLVLRVMEKGAFQQYMKSIGKLGGQNKVPKLSNDRKMADYLGT